MVDYLGIAKEKGILSPEQAEAVQAQVSGEGVDIIEAMEALGVNRDDFKNALAEYFSVEPGSFDPKVDTIEQSVLDYVPKTSAQHYRIVPLKIVDKVLYVAVTDPDNSSLLDALNFISTRKNITYKLILFFEDELETALEFYESLSGSVEEALTSIELDIDDVEPEPERTEEDLKEDAPITKIVATILRYAVDGSASDIHIEPTDDKIKVRFRIDGVLATSLELPKDVQSAVTARVKILSALRLDEKRKPQDGRFSAKIDGRRIDFRVSVFPINHGEKVVMRILDTEAGVRDLAGTGISDYALEAIKRAVELPYGIILISGPTGSGKSTTLYSMLGEVDRVGKNVLSLEDPVEYNIEGVSQSQVRSEIGYSFAAGLRAALRQDPDIIMVGEIRDKETAQLAIQAALTGHLVFSTIHTNNAIGVVPRLIDMGIDPYLIAPTLKLAIAQRLARRILPGTGRVEKVSDSIAKSFDDAFATLPEQFRSHIPVYDSVIHPEPSPGCASGTKGRVAVIETLEVNSEIEQLILNNGSEEDVYNAARGNGFISMRENAIIKALEHTIPYEEVSQFSTVILVAEEEEETLGSPPPEKKKEVSVEGNEIVEPVDNEPKTVAEVV